VQVAPIKPMLKAPGTKHLKLKCDILLSISAFKFDLRRYSKVCGAGTFLPVNTSLYDELTGRGLHWFRS
jgi:hypothetical protein